MKVVLPNTFKDVAPYYLKIRKNEIPLIEKCFKHDDYTTLLEIFDSISTSGAGLGLVYVCEHAENVLNYLEKGEFKKGEEAFNCYVETLSQLEVVYI